MMAIATQPRTIGFHMNVGLGAQGRLLLKEAWNSAPCIYASHSTDLRLHRIARAWHSRMASWLATTRGVCRFLRARGAGAVCTSIEKQSRRARTSGSTSEPSGEPYTGSQRPCCVGLPFSLKNNYSSSSNRRVVVTSPELLAILWPEPAVSSV